MRLKLPPIEIPPDNPFANDSLARKASAEVLTQFISTLQLPTVVGLEATWGGGKTTFIRMWMGHLRNQGYHCLYFNAWESDFTEDPLVAFIGEMSADLDQSTLEPETKDKAQEYFRQAKHIAIGLAKKSLPVSLKLATYGLLDLSAASEQAIGGFAADIAKEKIESYDSDKKTLKAFKDRLHEYATEIGQARDGQKRPVIFFIDELDRCRPPFALQVLERIKHLFDIDGLVFVLAVDKDQLGESIKTLYGQGMKVDGYLRRFIDIEYRLPDPSTEMFCKALFERFGFDEFFDSQRPKRGRVDTHEIITICSRLSSIFRFSLRVQEQCFSRLTIVFMSTPPEDSLLPILLATLVSLREANSNLYVEFTEGRTGAEEVLSFIREHKGGQEFLNENAGAIVETYLVASACKDDDAWSREKRKYAEMSENPQLDDNRRAAARTIAGMLKGHEFQWQIGNDARKYLAKKIGISDQFTMGKML